MTDSTALRALVARLHPGAVLEAVRPLGDDEAPADATRKGAGYGVPVRLTLRDAGGSRHDLVVHTIRGDEFGHDRRADRAQQVLLAYDTFRMVPRHVPAVDVGVIGPGGELRSIADAGELYLVTRWADGTPYADDVRRVAQRGVGDEDRRRLRVLIAYLADLHRQPGPAGPGYRRAVRDLLGSGEGIFGMVDGYPRDVPAAPAARLQGLEERCLAWRWRLRDRAPRLTRTHGDFHPFNILFDAGGELALLDASRGCAGDPADDVTALAINYVFFALDAPGAWQRGLGALWHELWSGYQTATGDRALLAVAAPWLAWRALVIANPRWYPGLSAPARDRLLTWIEAVLDAPALDPASADAVAP
jgi:aminoglycoside phosphotransferase (APT) family kinase protein